MTKTKSTRKVSVTVASIILAALMLSLCAVSFFVTRRAGGKALDNVLETEAAEHAKVVSAYADDSIRANAKFADNIFKKVSAASLAYTGEGSDLEKIATTLSFDTLLVTDDKGKITASYPEGAAGKYLKDDKNTQPLTVVAKGIAVKKLGEVQSTDDGYTVYAAAARQDAGGAIAAQMAADGYEELLGADLAESCGDNVIVEKDGKCVSSSFAAADEKAIADFTDKTDGTPFEIKLEGKTYAARVDVVGDYTVLTAIEKVKDNRATDAFLIILVTGVALSAAGVALLLLTGKKDEDTE